MYHVSCGPVGYWDVFGPDYNCIVLPYDGQAGIVEISLPNVFVQGFAEIGEVQGGFYRQLPFQRISEDDKFTIIRIELPEGESPVKIIGTQSGRADSLHNVGNVVMASVWVFGGLMIAWYGSIAAAKKVMERITKLRVR